MGRLTHIRHSKNYVPLAATIVTATSADVNFAATNAAKLPISKPWKSAAGVLDAKLLFDLGSAKAVDVIAIVSHNLRSGGTITVKAGTVSNPPGTDFQTTITWRDKLAWKIIASQTWRFWSIQFADNGHPDNHVRCGYVVLGLKITLSQTFLLEWKVRPQKIVRSVSNELGVPMVGSKIADGSIVTVSFGSLTDLERDEIHPFLDSLDLMVDPLLLVPDPDEADAYFCRLIETYDLEKDLYTTIPEVIFRTDHFGTVITS